MLYYWYGLTLHSNNAKESYFASLSECKKELQTIANKFNETIYVSYYLRFGIEKKINIIPDSKPKRLKSYNHNLYR